MSKNYFWTYLIILTKITMKILWLTKQVYNEVPGLTIKIPNFFLMNLTLTEHNNNKPKIQNEA